MQIKQIEPFQALRDVAVESFDVAVVGGGIVGLATLFQLLQELNGLKAVLVEKEDQLASHQTGHNSGVIHTGIYYKPGTAKAQLAVRGAKLMKQFCQTHGVPFNVCGKLIVASGHADQKWLDELLHRGLQNGVADLRLLRADEIAGVEPHAVGISAIHVPGAAVVDFRRVSEAIADGIRLEGGQIKLGFHVNAIDRIKDGYVIRSSDRTIQCRYLVACGGLQSDRLAAIAGVMDAPRIIPFRGEYYRLKSEAGHLVRAMIYPVPDPRFPFLGVHFTRRIDGSVEAGPNAVLAFKREGYKKTDFSFRDALQTLTYPGFLRLAGRFWRTGIAEMIRSHSTMMFTRSLQRLIPEIKRSHLGDGGAGVRAQALQPNGELVDDFHIIEAPHALFVCNAPSPAATASFAIAEHLTDRLRQLMKK